jgi:hypothetical protein
MIERFEHRVVSPHVELFHFIARCVLLTCRTENVDKPRHAHFTRDHFCGKRNVIKQVRKRARSFRMRSLLVDDVALDCDNRISHF